MTTTIHHRVAGAISLMLQQGRKPVRVWLAHNDWHMLTEASRTFQMNVTRARFMDVICTKDVFGGETRLIDENGARIYF